MRCPMIVCTAELRCSSSTLRKSTSRPLEGTTSDSKLRESSTRLAPKRSISLCGPSFVRLRYQESDVDGALSSLSIFKGFMYLHVVRYMSTRRVCYDHYGVKKGTLIGV